MNSVAQDFHEKCVLIWAKFTIKDGKYKAGCVEKEMCRVSERRIFLDEGGALLLEILHCVQDDTAGRSG